LLSTLKTPKGRQHASLSAEVQYGAIGAERMGAAAEILGLIVWIGERQMVGSASNIFLTECTRGTGGETYC